MPSRRLRLARAVAGHALIGPLNEARIPIGRAHSPRPEAVAPPWVYCFNPLFDQCKACGRLHQPACWAVCPPEDRGRREELPLPTSVHAPAPSPLALTLDPLSWPQGEMRRKSQPTPPVQPSPLHQPLSSDAVVSKPSAIIPQTFLSTPKAPDTPVERQGSQGRDYRMNNGPGVGGRRVRLFARARAGAQSSCKIKGQRQLRVLGRSQAW